MERPVSKDGDGAEAAPFSSEQELRLLVETLPTLVWQAEPEGNIEYVNKRVLDYFGAPLDEITGWGWVDRVHPDDIAFKVKNWLANLETKSPSDVVCRFRGADGQHRWFNVRGAPLKGSDGRVLRWYGVLIDVDDQKNAEEAVRESEYKLRQIFETVPGLIWLAEPNGNMSYVNQRILDYISAPFEETIGSGWEAFIHPDDRPETAKVFQQAIETTTSYEIVHRLRRSDGAYRWHHTRAEPMRDQQGNVIQWYGLSVDIDEAKRAEDRLRRSEAILAAAQRLSHSGALAYNGSAVLYWSEGAYRIWGFDPAQGIPDREAVFQRVHPEDRDGMRADIDRMLVDPTGSSSAFRIVLPDGAVRHLESIREPVFSASGEFLEIVSAQLDVTERKRAEQALRESEHNLRQIIETVPSLLWSLGPEGEQTRLNQRALDYIGVGYEDLVRLGWQKFLHPDDLAETAKAFSHAIQTGTSYEAVHRIRRADGEYRWHRARGEPLRDQQGRIVQWYGLSVDIDEAKKAEERLRRSETYLTEAQRLSHSGVAAYNETKILYGSEEIFRIWGVDPALGIPSLEAVIQQVHPDDRDRMRAQVQRAVDEKRDYSIAYRIVLPDGTTKHLEAIGRPAFSATGELIEIITTQLDVTERKRAEDQLRRSEAHLAEAQRLSHSGATAANKSKVLYFSEEAYRIWGFDPMLGIPTFEMMAERLHPDDRDRVLAGVQLAFTEKRGYSHEYRLLLPDGTIKHLESIGEPVFSPSGELFELVATQIDVTERKRAEQALRESEYKLRQIIDTVPGLIWSNEPGGEPSHVNQSMLDYSGMQFEDFKQRGWEEFVHPADFPETATAFYHAIETGTSYEGVFRLRRADGEFRWHHARCQPLRDQQGRIIQWYGLSVDVDEAKEAEDRLRRSEAYLAEAQRLSHTGTWALNTTTMHYLYWSDESYRIWAFDPRDGLPSRDAVWQRIHPDDRDRVWPKIQEAVDRKDDYSGEFRIVLPDRTVKHLAATSHHLFSSTGELVEVIGTNVDVTERKTAEQALRESEYKLRQLMDTVPGLTWSTGQPSFMAQVQAILNVLPAYTWYAAPRGALTFVNTRTAEYLGISDDHPLRFGIDVGSEWDHSFALLHPDDREGAGQYWASRLRTGEGGEHNYRVRGAQGDYRWFHTRMEPLRSSDGTLLLWIGATLDIEELTRAAEGLRESEAKFRDYAESASDWFWEIDPDHKFTLLTENAFGSDAADRIGTACWDGALDLETEPGKWRLLQETLDSHKPFRDFVYHSARSNGSPIHVKATGKPVFDADGEFRGYRGTGTDVTEIMRAQEALLASERHARSAIDGIAGLVLVLAPDGNLETVNRQVLEYFGQPLEWLKNWGENDVVHPEDLPRIVEIFTRATASGIPFSYELRLRRFDGEYRWFDNRGVPIRDDSGHILRWYVLLTDIEDRRRALQRLEQLQSDFAHMNRVSLMGELAASLSHEITQPIAAARNNARAAMHFLDRKSPDLAEIGEALASIVDDADRAGDIIDRIRDHIKKAPPRKSRFDLNEAIEEVIGLAQGAITTNGISVRAQLTESLAYVEGDRVQLQQVVLNLILNAVEAMSTVEPGRRELLVSTERIQTGGVVVSVRDSGPGIDPDPDSLDRVFQAFYTTKPNGVGMGLSISRSIIDAHGGRLWADVNVSGGAAFRFSLPGAGKELTNSRRDRTGEPGGDTVSDAAHQTAYEGNK